MKYILATEKGAIIHKGASSQSVKIQALKQKFKFPTKRNANSRPPI